MPFSIGSSSIYTDGQPLNTVMHAANLYNGGSPTAGIYSKMNGNITTADLRPGFQVQRAHIWPGEATMAEDAFMLSPIDFLPDGTNPGGDTWVPIPGASMRFYLPYDSLAIINVTMYCSPWRPFYVDDRPGSDTGRDREYFGHIWTSLFIDGVASNNDKRLCPFSAQISPHDYLGSSKLKSGDIRVHEIGQGFTWSMHRIKHMEAGWHDFHMAMKMSHFWLFSEAQLRRSGKTMDVWCYSRQRLFAGIRNARVLTMKYEV